MVSICGISKECKKKFPFFDSWFFEAVLFNYNFNLQATANIVSLKLFVEDVFFLVHT